jgi:hypothetical protein
MTQTRIHKEILDCSLEYRKINKRTRTPCNVHNTFSFLNLHIIIIIMQKQPTKLPPVLPYYSLQSKTNTMSLQSKTNVR